MRTCLTTHQPSDLRSFPKRLPVLELQKPTDTLYVYSGHTGKTHVYSRESLLPGFFRISLTNGGDWDPLSIGFTVLTGHLNEDYRSPVRTDIHKMKAFRRGEQQLIIGQPRHSNGLLCPSGTSLRCDVRFFANSSGLNVCSENRRSGKPQESAPLSNWCARYRLRLTYEKF